MRTPPKGVGGSSLRPSLITADSSGRRPKSDAAKGRGGVVVVALPVQFVSVLGRRRKNSHFKLSDLA